MSALPCAWLSSVPAASVLYDLLAAAALRHWMQQPTPTNDEAREPITCFRPLKAGVPRLREKLEMLLRATRPEDQILIGVDPGSEAEMIAGEVQEAFPEREVTVVPCGPAQAVNPKISKLVQMLPRAQHSAWLLSDSEVRLERDFLDAFRGEWAAGNVAALTAGYRFVNLESWAQRCDAFGVLLGLWPGLALLRRYGRVGFTLGACTFFRREALLAIGGWERFGAELAEDHRLGKALTQSGHRIALSRQVATLDGDPMSWRDYWRHQRRVSVTYRVANPWGFLGVLLTFGPMWSLLALQPGFWWLPLVALAVRGWRVGQAMRLLDFPVSGAWIAGSIASGVEAICWLLSWLTPRVWWSGRWWRVSFRGRLSPWKTG